MIKLKKTERHLAIVAAALIGIWLSHALLLQPAQDRIKTLERVVPQKQSSLIELQQKCNEYIALRDKIVRQARAIAARPNGFTPSKMVETAVARHGLAENLRSAQRQSRPLDDMYTEATVTVELEQITVAQLVQLMLDIRSSEDTVSTQGLRISRSAKNSKQIDSSIQLATLISH